MPESAARKSSTSPKPTSRLSPSETKCEKPTFLRSAQSSTMVPTVSRWETKPSLPGRAGICEKVALRPSPGTRMPSVLPPSRRISWRRVISRMLRSSGRPSAPSVASSWLAITITARVPRSPSSSTMRGTSGAGVHTMARSGVCGSAATLG